MYVSIKTTRRKGERGDTRIRRTSLFILYFPEVFQQILTGIVATITNNQ